jgi:hypothetical protein
MNHAIEAALRSQFKPAVDPQAIVITAEQLHEMKRTASISQLYGAYGRSNRASTGAQGKLFLLGSEKRC